MRISSTWRRRLIRLWLPVLSSFLVVYFSYHLVQGDRGLIARDRLVAEIDEAGVRLAALQADRERLEHRVDGLSPASIDPDLLEEQIRARLHWAHPDELIISLTDE